jgi:hypothetical protein
MQKTSPKTENNHTRCENGSTTTKNIEEITIVEQTRLLRFTIERQ